MCTTLAQQSTMGSNKYYYNIMYKKVCCMCKVVFLLVIKPIDFLCRSHYCRHLSLNYFIFCLSIL